MRAMRVVCIALLAVVAATGLSEAQEVAGKIGLTPSIGVVIPTGDFADDVEGSGATTGFSGGFDFEYFINENVVLGGKFVYDRFGINTDEAEREYPEVDWDANWTVIEFGAFAKYIFTPISPTRVFGRVGFILGKVDGEIKGSQAGVSATADFDISTAVGLEGGIGVMHLVSESMGIFGEVSFTHLMTDGADATATIAGISGSGEWDSDTQWYGFRGGVTFLLGGR